MAKILVVDDDTAILDVLEKWLAARKHCVVSDNNPVHAMAVFRQAAAYHEPFDLLITDFKMPEWSGLTLALRIKDCCTCYQIPKRIICVTGNVEDAERFNKRDGSPINIVIEKGCPLQQIEDAIKAVLLTSV